MTEKRNRFPGAKPFTADDKEVFHGREKDIDKLFDLLTLKRMIVLYAESGIGKSSLVNAGLIPKYQFSAGVKENYFLTVKIRFGLSQFTDESKEASDILLIKIIEEISLHKNLLKYESLPFVEEKPEKSLWCLVKLFERNNIKLLIAFDQFEEIFTYSSEQINLFKEQVFSLFSGVPKDINDIISAKVKHAEEEALNKDVLVQLEQDLKFVYAPLNTHILYIIREDKLGFFNSFTDYFPNVLKDTFKLLPLKHNSAVEAIALPAGKAGDFKTAPFTFSQPALDKLLSRLAEKNDTYDPFTIQLTCRYIEKTLIDEGGKRQIEENDIPEVGIIVKDFIDGVWRALPPGFAKKVNSYKETIETKLIAHDIEKRISVHEGGWIDDEVVTVMINEGLLKRDRRGGVDYVELSHDRLIKPLLEDYKFRKQQVKASKRKKQNVGIGSLVLALIFITGYFVVNAHIEETDTLVEQNGSLTTSKEELRKSLASKANIIETYEKKENNDSAKMFASVAKELVKKKDYEKADAFFKKAIAASFKAEDNSVSDSLTSLREKLIPKTIEKVEDIRIYKIDVFYDERTLPDSENTADWIIERLEKNSAFIVRKRLLTIERISKSPTWDIQSNLIRHDQNRKEKSFADSLLQDFNHDDFIAANEKSFQLQPVRLGRTTPNYVSIFIHN